jgi:hypothetical protein
MNFRITKSAIRVPPPPRHSGESIEMQKLIVMSVIVGVMLTRFGCVVRGVVLMALCDVGVMPGLLVVAVGVVFCRGPVMPCRVLVMFRSFQVVLGDLFGHKVRPFWSSDFPAARA